METTRVSTKGQIVLPQSIRLSREWGPGTELTVEEAEGGVLLRRKKGVPVTTIDEVFGCLKSSRRSRLTRKDIRAAIDKEVKRRHARGRY